MAKKRFEPDVSAEELDKFEQFIFEMDDALEPFIATAAAAGFRLDYSIDSLDTLETFLLSDAANGGESLIQNRAARYLGEVFRKNVGGQWELCLNLLSASRGRDFSGVFGEAHRRPVFADTA